MSFRGGRGGGGGGFQKQHLPFGLEYSDINSNNIDSEKPTIPLPVNGTLTNAEKIIGSRFINFSSLVKDGPFYTGSNLDVNSKDARKKVEFDAEGFNDGLKRYSDRYLKKRKIGPSIDDHPYAIEFFPQELYAVMGVDDKTKKKLLNLSRLKQSADLLEKLQVEGGDNSSLLDQLKNSLDDEEKEEKDEEKEQEEENLDDEFEEDDDDDYNAEKYFDDGEDFGDLEDFDDEAAF